MKLLCASVIVVCCAASMGCASVSPVPAGLKPGHFVALNCDAEKRLQVRAAVDGSTVRIRYEGGYELDAKGNGVYEGEGWHLVTADGVVALSHHGKTVLRGCRASA